jgi:thiol-disulfide isomerase/thioredoxin
MVSTHFLLALLVATFGTQVRHIFSLSMGLRVFPPCLFSLTVQVRAASAVTEIKNAAEFEKLVEADTRAWVVEFGSKFCESCKEFAPIYKAEAAAIKTLKFGKVYIDEKPGMELAQRFGVLNLGLPAVVLFTEKDSGSFSAQAVNDGSSAAGFRKQLTLMLAHATRDAQGVFVKAEHTSDL